MHKDNVSICTIITMFTICSVFPFGIFSLVLCGRWFRASRGVSISLAVREYLHQLIFFPIVLHAGHFCFILLGIFNDMSKCYTSWLVNSTPSNGVYGALVRVWSWRVIAVDCGAVYLVPC